MSTEQATEYINRIVKYCTELGIEVKLHSNSYGYYRDDSVITANSRSYGTTLYICSLLHEIGHALQAPSTFVRNRNTRARNIAIILEQEYQAWYIGHSLITELHLPAEELTTEYIQLWQSNWIQYCTELCKNYSNTEVKRLVAAYIE